MMHDVKYLFNSRMKRLNTSIHIMVKYVCSNEEGEYVGSDFHKWLKWQVVVHEVSIACHSELNRKVEQLNKTVLDMAW